MSQCLFFFFKTNMSECKSLEWVSLPPLQMADLTFKNSIGGTLILLLAPNPISESALILVSYASCPLWPPIHSGWKSIKMIIDCYNGDKFSCGFHELQKQEQALWKTVTDVTSPFIFYPLWYFYLYSEVFYPVLNNKYTQI